LTNKDQADLIESINHNINGLPRSIYKQLTQQISTENAVTIVEFIECQKTESNLSDTYKNLVIKSLITLIKYFTNKNFKQLTRVDIINYLDSLRKPEEADPLHKWIGTYNLRRMIFLKFFKWLYNPTGEPKKRKFPEVIRDIPMLMRKEQSIYKPDDLWSPEDDQLFLKYCPDKRIQCYHAISRDTSARPSEILKLRVKEINFKLAGDKTYAEISLNGKTGSRVIPLFNSIPYIKDWIKNHPQPGNPNALLIPSMNRATLGRKLSSISLNLIYRNYKTIKFPRLLDDENVPIEDKNKIRELLKKKWNPYIRRHTGLTEKSKMKQINEHQLRQLAGWSPRSQMHLKYIHYFGNEASESLLEAYGITTRNQELSKTLLYKQCPHCNEPNKPDTRFCAKCNMILTYDAYIETLEAQKQKEESFNAMEKQVNSMQSQLQKLILALGNMNGNNKISFARELFHSGILEVNNENVIVAK
jgi:integrase/recombinase XerD